MAATRFDPIAHAKAMRESGFWVDKSCDQFLRPTVSATPDKLALLAYRSDRTEGRHFTYDGQLLSLDGGVSSTHPYGRIALPS